MAGQRRFLNWLGFLVTGLLVCTSIFFFSATAYWLCNVAPQAQQAQQAQPPLRVAVLRRQGNWGASGEQHQQLIKSQPKEARSYEVGLDVPVVPAPDAVAAGGSEGAKPEWQPQQLTQHAELEPGLSYLANHFAGHSCTSPVPSKQSCMFHNVCFFAGTSRFQKCQGRATGRQLCWRAGGR